MTTPQLEHFRTLHRPGAPLLLVNAWDAGSARAVAEAGASAIATSSWAVAAAQGLPDGEALAFDELVRVAEAIARSVDLPLSVDFEAGYADTPAQVAANARRLRDARAIGCNLEDRAGDGVRPIKEQTGRIAAVVDAGLFVNARTDLFLQGAADAHAGLLGQAIERAHAYRDAGAGSFFAPGLADHALVRQLCAASPVPVNIMLLDLAIPVAPLAALGVARISYGPAPYLATMGALAGQARSILAP